MTLHPRPQPSANSDSNWTKIAVWISAVSLIATVVGVVRDFADSSPDQPQAPAVRVVPHSPGRWVHPTFPTLPSPQSVRV